MTAKEYLQQVHAIEHKINRLMQQRSEYKAELYSAGCSPSGNTIARVCRTIDPDKMGELSARIDAADRKIVHETQKLITAKEMICGQISQLDKQDHSDVLYQRYIHLDRGRYRAWPRIAKELNFSERQVHNLHGAALIAFQKRFGRRLKRLQ